MAANTSITGMKSSMLKTHTSNNLFISLKVFWILTNKFYYLYTVREQILSNKEEKINSTIKTVAEAHRK